jgi:hypothetical protein
MIDPGKYTVIKTADLHKLMDGRIPPHEQQSLKRAIEDQRKHGATVILPEDVFAAPALFSYAASISVALHLLPPNHPDRAHLRELADYFQSQGDEAMEKSYKVPD